MRNRLRQHSADPAVFLLMLSVCMLKKGLEKLIAAPIKEEPKSL
jgi:hypothetical protein